MATKKAPKRKSQLREEYGDFLHARRAKFAIELEAAKESGRDVAIVFRFDPNADPQQMLDAGVTLYMAAADIDASERGGLQMPPEVYLIPRAAALTGHISGPLP